MQNSQLGHHVGPPIASEKAEDADMFKVFKRLARRWDEYIIIKNTGRVLAERHAT